MGHKCESILQSYSQEKRCWKDDAIFTSGTVQLFSLSCSKITVDHSLSGLLLMFDLLLLKITKSRYVGKLLSLFKSIFTVRQSEITERLVNTLLVSLGNKDME